jgi:hypothetical protein
MGSTFFWYASIGCILVAFLRFKRTYYDTFNDKNIQVVLFYLIWNIICIARGFAVAENYWEWKNLIGTALVLLLPLSIYVFTNTLIIQRIVSTWLRYALPAFFLFLPFFQASDAFGRYLVPISFLLLFFPILPWKWKIITLVFTTLVVFGGLDARSNVIKFCLAFLIGFLFYFRDILQGKVLQILRILFLATPIVLFVLALTGRFNVFQMDKYVDGAYSTSVVQNGIVKEEDLTADTRTLLYDEVLSSAKNNDYIFFGRTPARGNDSELFGSVLADDLQTGKMERFSNEVSILNIFTWTGVIGVILYFVIFYQATYLAINRSNNMFIRLIGLYVSFRWTYAWVEDFSDFDLSYLFLWLMVGMCFSKAFRAMTDLEMKDWLMEVVDSRYLNYKLFLLKQENK